MKRKKVVRKMRRRPENLVCNFCVSKKEPDYKEYLDLRKYLSGNAKILGKDISGVCSKHQRKLARSIKRARFLGLLPFSPSV